MLTPRRTPRLLIVIGAAVLLLTATLLAAAFAWPTDPAVAPTAPPSAALDPTAVTAYDELSPKLRAAAAQAAALVDLGEERSRNLFAIRAAQREMTDRLAAADEVAARPFPARFALALAAYRTGAETSRQAMVEAESAFLRFDWERVAAATALLTEGATALDRACRHPRRRRGSHCYAAPRGERRGASSCVTTG